MLYQLSYIRINNAWSIIAQKVFSGKHIGATCVDPGLRQ